MNCLVERLVATVLMGSCLAGAAAAGAEWHHPLYLDGGGWWSGRVRVVVENERDAPLEGEPVAVRIGGSPGDAGLVGEAAEAIRVCTEEGVEMLFALYGPGGSPWTEGPIPEGSSLVLPAECPERGRAVYYVYFDNPAAGPLPDFLKPRAGSVGGHVTRGAGAGKVRAVAERPERMDMSESGGEGPWYGGRRGDEAAWDHRATVKVFNFADEPITRSPVSVDLGMLENRMRGRLNRDSIVVTEGGEQVPHSLYGNALLFEGSVPGRTVKSYHVYFSDDPRLRAGARADYRALLAGDRNLVKNPSFEQGEPLPDDWSTSDPSGAPRGVTYGLDEPGRPELGRRCVKMHVRRDAAGSWRGWHQRVPVEPGRTYLLAAWLKCEGIRDGGVRVHAHCHGADGRLISHGAFVSVGQDISGTTDWTLMSGRVTMPEGTATLQLHLTMDKAGTLWHDGVLLAEVVPHQVVALEGRPVEPSDGVVVWPVPAVAKVFRDDPVPRAIRRAAVSAARNEREPLELAVRSGRALARVRVAVDPPVGPQGVRLEDLEVNVVGYVPIDQATNYYRSESPAWHRKVPAQPGRSDGWPGQWPDPLLPRDTFDLEANTTQAIWVTVGVPRGAPAGDYTGTVRLVCDGEPVARVPFDVHVWDFTLPDESHLAAIYDVRLGPGGKLWGKPLEEIYPEMVRFMADRRLCPDKVRPYPMIKVQDGRVVADFTAFDEAAEYYFDELKLPYAYMPWYFYVFGWGHPPRAVFGQRPYPGDPPYEGADRSRLRPEYRKNYQAGLRAYWEHLKEKGWHKKVVLYISDEPYDRHRHIVEQMQALCDMIHEVDPEIPIYSSTWRHVPAWDGYLDVWGIGHDGRVPAEKMAKLRARGDRLWFTTDGQMCTDTPYCAVERLLPHYCFKYGVEAYEFWGVAWLTYDPYRYGWHSYIRQTSEPGRSFWVRYPNGDGFLIYPGGPIGHRGLVSSVRLEQAREGVEDYEYLYLLRQLIGEAKAAGKDVTEAEEAMAEAAALVEMPNAGGRYSSRILPDPEDLYQVRQDLAAAIEQLSR